MVKILVHSVSVDTSFLSVLKSGNGKIAHYVEWGCFIDSHPQSYCQNSFDNIIFLLTYHCLKQNLSWNQRLKIFVMISCLYFFGGASRVPCFSSLTSITGKPEKPLLKVFILRNYNRSSRTREKQLMLQVLWLFALFSSFWFVSLKPTIRR